MARCCYFGSHSKSCRMSTISTSSVPCLHLRSELQRQDSRSRDTGSRAPLPTFRLRSKEAFFQLLTSLAIPLDCSHLDVHSSSKHNFSGTEPRTTPPSKNFKQPPTMDLAKQLVRSCARAFYSQPPFDVRHVLIIDALVIHGALVSP